MEIKSAQTLKFRRRRDSGKKLSTHLDPNARYPYNSLTDWRDHKPCWLELCKSEYYELSKLNGDLRLNQNLHGNWTSTLPYTTINYRRNRTRDFISVIRILTVVLSRILIRAQGCDFQNLVVVGHVLDCESSFRLFLTTNYIRARWLKVYSRKENRKNIFHEMIKIIGSKKYHI